MKKDDFSFEKSRLRDEVLERIKDNCLEAAHSREEKTRLVIRYRPVYICLALAALFALLIAVPLSISRPNGTIPPVLPPESTTDITGQSVTSERASSTTGASFAYLPQASSHASLTESESAYTSLPGGTTASENTSGTTGANTTKNGAASAVTTYTEHSTPYRSESSTKVVTAPTFIVPTVTALPTTETHSPSASFMPTRTAVQTEPTAPDTTYNAPTTTAVQTEPTTPDTTYNAPTTTAVQTLPTTPDTTYNAPTTTDTTNAPTGHTEIPQDDPEWYEFDSISDMEEYIYVGSKPGAQYSYDPDKWKGYPKNYLGDRYLPIAYKLAIDDTKYENHSAAIIFKPDGKAEYRYNMGNYAVIIKETGKTTVEDAFKEYYAAFEKDRLIPYVSGDGLEDGYVSRECDGKKIIYRVHYGVKRLAMILINGFSVTFESTRYSIRDTVSEDYEKFMTDANMAGVSAFFSDDDAVFESAMRSLYAPYAY